jgi:XapX domain-containing protein
VKIYVLSLSVGVLVGLIYGLLQVRSPAPPVVALIGLLGMLLGEQLATATKRVLHSKPVTMAWVRSECLPRITGINKPSPGRAPAGLPQRGCSEQGARDG